MGKYISKTQMAREIVVMEVSRSVGVSTRARILALWGLQKSSPLPSDEESYLQLRSHRLRKPAILADSKRQKPEPRSNANPNSNSKAKLGSRRLVQKKGSSRQNMGEVIQEGKVEGDAGDTKDLVPSACTSMSRVHPLPSSVCVHSFPPSSSASNLCFCPIP